MMDSLPETVMIAPDRDCLKQVVECQCSIGKEKLLTAPPYKRVQIVDLDFPGTRYQTATCARNQEQHNCLTTHILVTFKSPKYPDEVFNKVFPSSTSIKSIRKNIAKLVRMSNSNILLTKNRKKLKDTEILSELKTDSVGQITINVYSKDDEYFTLSSIAKETYVQDLLNAGAPERKCVQFVAIKFKVRNQNGIFTRSYHSIMKIHEVKKNLAALFICDPDNLVILRHDRPLKDRMALLDLDYDIYGNIEAELLTKNRDKLKLERVYKEIPVNDVLTVTVPIGNKTKLVNVEIFWEPYRKPYLGGYKNIHTGTIYHHTFTQTPQKPEKLPPEKKSCRDTQTAEEREKVFDTPYSRATQMYSEKIFIPSVTDKIIIPKPYETYEEMIARLNHGHYATIIQKAFRHHQFRQKIFRWLEVCKERIARMKEEERLEKEAMERRLKRDLVTKTFPRSREDFDQLYSMVDRWKTAEINRISQLHSKGPKIAEFTLLLDKEVELLRCIESYRVKIKNDNMKLKERSFLEEISKPVAWYARDGKLITMDTVEIQKARKLKELYFSFIREDMQVRDRMELLVDMKFALQEFRHPLAEEIISLLDRECDLMVRNCNDQQLEFLRQRIATSIFHFIKTSDLNHGVTKSHEVRDYRKMADDGLYFCEMCHQVKMYTDFPLNAKMKGFLVCTSCSWKDVSEKCWIDMTPYKFILRAVQRDERRRRCWGSLAFVLQEKDVFFLVEKIWLSRSVISECSDLVELRLCRWDVNKDWSPWNCFLVTVQEMKAHLKLEAPEDVYDEELVKKIKNRHILAKANFEQLMCVDKRFTESGDWQGIQAPACARVNGVEPL